MTDPKAEPAETGGEEVRRIQRMKAELQAHFDRFKALRAAGRDAEALAQFNVTLRAASTLMETSTRVLKDLAVRAAAGHEAEVAPDVAPEVRGKVLHLPRRQQTH